LVYVPKFMLLVTIDRNETLRVNVSYLNKEG